MNTYASAKHLFVHDDASILDALGVIEKGNEQIAFVVDGNDRLVRVVTDGDIRRALLSGKALNSPIRDIHDRIPVVVRQGTDFAEAQAQLGSRIRVAPVIDSAGRVVGSVRARDIPRFVDIKSRQVLVVGLGYVGLTLALVLADRNFTVTGYDINPKTVESLKNKSAPFFEKGLQNFLDLYIDNGLRVVSSLSGISADIYIISVGTPIDKATGKPDTSQLRRSAESVGAVLKRNDLVVLRSTVPLGTTREVVLPILEAKSGLKGGTDFFLAFCPERTAEGRALEELVKLPQIVGGLDSRSVELASRLFFENTHTVVDVGSLEAAEMCKLMDNTFRDTVFAYANQMAMLAERAGLNLSDLIDKVNLGYQRNAIPKPSPGVGGPCLSKDPYILASVFERYGLDCPVIMAARDVNKMAPAQIYERTRDLLAGVDKPIEKAKVFMIGFAFKGQPQTSDIRDSTSLWILDEFKARGVTNIWGHDPVVDAEEIRELGVRPCSVEDGFLDADAVLILNNHRSYAHFRLFDLAKTMRRPGVFYDTWQIFSPSDVRRVPGLLYASVGVG